MKSRKSFLKHMTLLGEIHNRNISEVLLEVYWAILKPYDDAICEAVFTRLVQELDFFPKPSDFNRALADTLPAIPAPSDKAQLQIAVVMKQIRELGSYCTPVFDDPVTKSLMSSRWSWRSVCSMTETELKWWAKEFTDAYLSHDKMHTQMISGGNEVKLKLLVGGIG